MSASNQVVQDNTERTKWEWLAVGVAVVVGLLSAVFPLWRAFFTLQIDYNEGWNVYNAARVVHHVALYAQRHSWTPVIYPPLSFYFIAWLHTLGWGYLVAGRVLSIVSLFVSCALVGLIVWRLSHDLRAAVFASFFCLAVFCNAATPYVGMDDPQIFAQVFFLGGLLLYISGPPDLWRLGATSLLFIVGGNIKHSLVDFPLAVLVDLCFVGRKQVAEYVAISSVLLGASISITMWVAGPYFISNILLPRSYSLMHAFTHFVLTGFGTVEIPLVIAAFWSVRAFRNGQLRVCSIFFWSSLLVGLVFGGGRGEDVNTFFDLFLSLSVMIGLFLHWFWQRGASGLGLMGRWSPAEKVGLPLIFLLSLAPSFFALSHRTAIRELPAQQRRFLEEVTFLRSRPGSAICESLLLCYEAGKTFQLSPFDSLMLIEARQMNERPIIQDLWEEKFGAIQLDHPVSWYLQGSGRFTQGFAAATAGHYKLAFTRPGCYIYIPASQAQ